MMDSLCGRRGYLFGFVLFLLLSLFFIPFVKGIYNLYISIFRERQC